MPYLGVVHGLLHKHKQNRFSTASLLWLESNVTCRLKGKALWHHFFTLWKRKPIKPAHRKEQERQENGEGLPRLEAEAQLGLSTTSGEVVEAKNSVYWARLPTNIVGCVFSWPYFENFGSGNDCFFCTDLASWASYPINTGDVIKPPLFGFKKSYHTCPVFPTQAMAGTNGMECTARILALIMLARHAPILQTSPFMLILQAT